MKLTEQH